VKVFGSSLPMISSADAYLGTLSLEVQHREFHSTHQEHREGTNDCSLGISMVIFFLQVIDFASGISRGDHPSENLSSS